MRTREDHATRCWKAADLRVAGARNEMTPLRCAIGWLVKRFQFGVEEPEAVHQLECSRKGTLLQ